MGRALAIASAVVGALLLSGCGDATPQPGSGPGGAAPGTPTGSTTTPASSPTEPVATSTTASPSGVPPASGRELILDGVVQVGVESGCKVLTASSGQYLILRKPDVPMGVPVRVRGVVITGVSTTCQQGTPLRVLDVQRR